MSAAADDFLPQLGSVALTDADVHPSAGIRTDDPLIALGTDRDTEFNDLWFGSEDDPGIKGRGVRPGNPDLVGDLLNSGHGYQIRDVDSRPKTTWATRCEICGESLPMPDAGEWVCELGAEPDSEDWAVCQCSWCLIRGQWLRGEYRPKAGRPPKRCGTADCKRRAATVRKRKERALKRQRVQVQRA
ncbi:hypothetical protein KTR9_3391 [Gordonia sp. KTR9]|nr:hypothetical protein KTR9_3391 [Gordonia sp. KTR9]